MITLEAIALLVGYLLALIIFTTAITIIAWSALWRLYDARSHIRHSRAARHANEH